MVDAEWIVVMWCARIVAMYVSTFSEALFTCIVFVQSCVRPTDAIHHASMCECAYSKGTSLTVPIRMNVCAHVCVYVPYACVFVCVCVSLYLCRLTLKACGADLTSISVCRVCEYHCTYTKSTEYES